MATGITASILPSQMAMKSDSPSGQTGRSFIADLASVKPEQAGAFADKAFLALDKDGIKFLPFLTALVKAFDQAGGATASAPAAGKDGKADIGAATQSLLAFRNANKGVKDLDKAIEAISKALPNLTQADFDSILATLKTAAAPSAPAAGSPQGSKGSVSSSPGGNLQVAESAQPEVDTLELGLLEAQIGAAVGKNGNAAASTTGNQALDLILGAITDIGKDGVTSDEMASLTSILESTVKALLGEEKAASVLSSLRTPAGSSKPEPGKSGTVQVSISIGEDSGSPQTSPVSSSRKLPVYDPINQSLENAGNRFIAAGSDPNSTGGRVLEAMLSGFSVGDSNKWAKALAESKKPVSSVDLS